MKISNVLLFAVCLFGSLAFAETELATCISNGGVGSFEKYTPYYKGEPVGGETNKYNCQLMVNNQNGPLLCVSNGSLGSFEKFNVRDLGYEQDIGGGTALNNCIMGVRQSRDGYICVSNGGTDSLEQFQLIKLYTGEKIGEETTLYDCLMEIP